MATLTIRNLPDEVRDALRIRAARNRRSMEAEARLVLVQATGARPQFDPEEIKSRLQQIRKVMAPYKLEGRSLVDELIADRRWEAACEEAEFLGLRKPDRSTFGAGS